VGGEIPVLLGRGWTGSVESTWLNETGLRVGLCRKKSYGVNTSQSGEKRSESKMVVGNLRKFFWTKSKIPKKENTTCGGLVSIWG